MVDDLSRRLTRARQREGACLAQADAVSEAAALEFERVA
jgi:hypothetical protein